MQGELDADGLIAAAAALLENEIAPASASEMRFKALMALAALRMAERERRFADQLSASTGALLIAGEVKSLQEFRDVVRKGGPALSDGMREALLRDAVLRTAVTKPAALTVEERKQAGLL